MDQEMGRQPHKLETTGRALPAAPLRANSKAGGERREGVILGRLLELGRTVLLPFGNNQRYDLVVDSGRGAFIRGQCKTGRYRNGVVTFASCSTNGFTGKSQTYKDQADVFWIYCPELRKVYEVPVEAVGVKRGYLRVDAPRSRQKCMIRWARDYELPAAWGSGGDTR